MLTGSRLAIALAGVLLLQVPDASSSPRDELFVRAQGALHEVRFVEAFELFEKLEREGGSDRSQLREIQQGLAEIAATIGRADEARRRYQILLTLDPAYRLPDGAPRSFLDAFEAARSDIGNSPGLQVRTKFAAQKRQLTVSVERDVANIAGEIRVLAQGGGELARSTGGPLGEVSIPPEVSAVRVLVLDVYGNELQVLPALATVDPIAANVAISERAPSGEKETPSPWSRPSVWLATASAVSLGAGLTLGSTVADRQSALEEILANSIMYRLTDAEEARSRLERRALQANLAFAGAGLLTLGAVASYWWEQDQHEEMSSSLSVLLSEDQTMLVLTGSMQ